MKLSCTHLLYSYLVTFKRVRKEERTRIINISLSDFFYTAEDHGYQIPEQIKCT